MSIASPCNCAKDAVSASDKAILRELAKEIAGLAAKPEQKERIRRWKDHNSLKPGRPMMLIFPEGSWEEIAPSNSVLKCENPLLRGYELGFRRQLHEQRHFNSDNVLDGTLDVSKKISNTGWGFEAKWHHSEMAGGARSFNPVIIEPADLKKFKVPEVIYDEAASVREYELVRDLLGDILPVRLRGVRHVSFHLMSLYTSWRGLEETMMDMYAEPAMLHDAMAFLEKGHHEIIRQYESMRLLDLNNDNSYHSSGGNGWNDELPAPGFDPAHVRPKDLWASAEAQELALVSPEMHKEFSLDYESRLLEPFGLIGYGCCEDLTKKLDDVLAIPNIRRISISPFANVERSAEKIGNRAIVSWKPQPAHLVGNFDDKLIESYIRKAVGACAANNCVMEIILKDTHTCERHPERFDTWTQICRRVIG